MAIEGSKGKDEMEDGGNLPIKPSRIGRTVGPRGGVGDRHAKGKIQNITVAAIM